MVILRYVAVSALKQRASGEEGAIVVNRRFLQRGGRAAVALLGAGACFLGGLRDDAP